MTIRYPMFNIQIHVPVDEPEVAVRGKRRKTRSARSPRTEKVVTEEPAKKPEEQQGESTATKPATDPSQPVLMVEVENLKHNDYKQTEEVKALTQEVIKTIRDIITMNPLYRLVATLEKKNLDSNVMFSEKVFNKCFIRTKELWTIQCIFAILELRCQLLNRKSYRKF